MARPKKEIDEQQMGVLCRLIASAQDCADYFGVSVDTIDRRVKEWGYSGFAEFKQQNMVHTRFQLKRDALERAKTSDTMLIFCLKNLCGWKDKVDHSSEDGTMTPKGFGDFYADIEAANSKSES